MTTGPGTSRRGTAVRLATAKPRVFVTVMVFALGACSAEPNTDTVLTAAVDSFVGPYASSGNFSGMVLVTRGGKEVAAGSFGLADHGEGRSFKPRTRFRIGSITKSFTAAAVLLLRDRGAFRLDDPVGRFVPDFPHGDDITIRHLLAHRSGLGNYYFLPDFRALSQEQYAGPAEVIALIGGQPLQFDPGTRHAYNNVNYTALAWLIEMVSGITYDEFLAREFLSPLGLGDTGDGSESGDGGVEFALGHEPVGIDELTPSASAEYSLLIGAGSLGSTARDVAGWLAAVENGDALRGSSREELIEYGRLADEFLERRALTASGWDGMGFGAYALHLPSDSLTVVVLCNVNIAGISQEIAEGVAALALGARPVRTPLAPRALPADSLRRLAGTFVFGDDFYVPRGQLRLSVSDGWLTDTGRTPSASLIPLANGEFLYRPTWARVSFFGNGGGSVDSLLFAGRFIARREPQS